MVWSNFSGLNCDDWGMGDLLIELRLFNVPN